MTTAPPFLLFLGLDATADERAIKRAYASELKKIDQEADPGGFQSLREAYEAALYWLRWQQECLEEQETPPRDEPTESFRAPDEKRPEPAQEEIDAPCEGSLALKSAPQLQVAQDNPESVSQAVFSEFVAQLSRPDIQVSEIRRELELCLDDARLINIESRDYFEWRVACHLAGGWQPGNESLISIAADRFNWNNDRQRLFRFGQIGATLDRAIHELTLFKQQTQDEQTAQLQLIRKLRLDVQPGVSDLIRKLGSLEQTAARFPFLFPMITNANNLLRWREWEAAVPAWRRVFVRRRLSEIAPNNEKSSFRFPAGLFWLLIFLAIMGKLAAPPAGNSASVQSPASSLAPSTYQAPTGKAQYPMSPMPKAAEKTVPSSPPSPQQMASITKGRVDASKCDAAAKVALDYSSGMSYFGAHLGAPFDQRIISCVNANLWPRPVYADPAVTAAIQNERRRAEKEMDRLAKSFKKDELVSKPLPGYAPEQRTPLGTQVPPQSASVDTQVWLVPPKTGKYANSRPEDEWKKVERDRRAEYEKLIGQKKTPVLPAQIPPSSPSD